MPRVLIGQQVASITSGGGRGAESVGWAEEGREIGADIKVLCVYVRARARVGMRLNLCEDQPFVSPSSDFYARCRASISRINVSEFTPTPSCVSEGFGGSCLQRELHNYSLLLGSWRG